MKRIFFKLLQVENLYLKFILTVIAIAVVMITIELPNRNYHNLEKLIGSSIKMDNKEDIYIKGSGTKTKYTLIENGNEYPIFITKEGSTYILKLDKDCGEYKYYLPIEVSEIVNKK